MTPFRLAACGLIALFWVTDVEAQSMPPPHVEYEPPYRSVLNAVHDCPSGQVSIDVSGTWSLGSHGTVRVEAYSGAAGPASAEDLENWNDWLTDLTSLASVEVRCQAGGNETITIRGGGPGRSMRSVSTWWWRGVLGRVGDGAAAS